MEYSDFFTAAATAAAAVLWVIGEVRAARKESATALDKLNRKLNRIDKHKVSYKMCDRKRSECAFIKKHFSNAKGNRQH
jgi:hypothetical protein